MSTARQFIRNTMISFGTFVILSAFAGMARAQEIDSDSSNVDTASIAAPLYLEPSSAWVDATDVIVPSSVEAAPTSETAAGSDAIAASESAATTEATESLTAELAGSGGDTAPLLAMGSGDEHGDGENGYDEGGGSGGDGEGEAEADDHCHLQPVAELDPRAGGLAAIILLGGALTMAGRRLRIS